MSCNCVGNAVPAAGAHGALVGGRRRQSTTPSFTGRWLDEFIAGYRHPHGPRHAAGRVWGVRPLAIAPALRDTPSSRSTSSTNTAAAACRGQYSVQDWMYWRENAWARISSTRIASPILDGWTQGDPRPPRPADDIRLGQILFRRLRGQRKLLGDASRCRVSSTNRILPRASAIGSEMVATLHVYDAFNPGRGPVLEQIDAALFRRGRRCVWMDATEPDVRAASPRRSPDQHFIGQNRARLRRACPQRLCP